MGKSAKFYKRPSKKQKEGLNLKKLVEPSAISKTETKKTISTQAAEAIVKDLTKKKEKSESKTEKPDYVDLFSGRKTYKKVPARKRH
ncbi:hypothetical protein G6F56_000041 [Rhizopus delemar]|nr:hypothetical protein G6F56_000041 [Rhizopus delemar]